MSSNKMNVVSNVESSIRIAPAFGMANENAKKINHVYIPRISEHYTEDQVRYMFAYAGLAEVEYVDFVKLKPLALPKVIPGEEPSKEKEIPKFSAFVSISRWLTSKAVDEIAEKGSHKFYVSSNSKEFWMLLPNNAPLARTKVNVHQLASYTDELYTKLDTVTDELKQHQYMLYEQTMRIEKQNEIIEAQTIQIKQLFNLCGFQNGQITELHNTIREMLSFSPVGQYEEDTSLEPLTLADLDGPEPQNPESNKRTFSEFTDSDDEEPVSRATVDIKPENKDEAEILSQMKTLPVMTRSVAQDYTYGVNGLKPVIMSPDSVLADDSLYEEDDKGTYAPVKGYVRHAIPEKEMKEVSRRLFSDGICNN